MALENIGPYKFQGILGRGGMGTVYRGVHRETGEIHAVKVLAPTYAHDEHFRGRFESEIKSLMKLDHKNIVRLLSYGQEGGMLFFSMELVEGNSLFQMQNNRHRFNWREILSIGKDVGNGLRHIHDRGIIHRDLKPGNLLMTTGDDGTPPYVKITDFGIAKRFGTSQNTGENVLGTMDFMSPEQAKGEPVTIRSDLYSLGTVLFTLLSGKPPFTSNSVEESLRSLTQVPAPPVSSMGTDVPPELDDLIQRLMVKRADKRIQTAQSLLFQIEEVEKTLRNSSEAKTTQRSALKTSEDTFDVQVPQTEKRTGTNLQSSGTDVPDSQRRTLEFTDHDHEKVESRATQIDYFNTVTDQVRKKQTVGEEHKHSVSGIWPLALGLAAVVLLGGFGIYQSYKAPAAEELFTKIELSADRPNRILKEIDEFLNHYPDEPRASRVKELKQVGEAINRYNSLRNTLTVRRNLPGENRLSEIERQFLGIVDLAETDPALADAKMAAFVTVHESTELNQHDRKCVDAAKGYQLKLKNDARSEVMFNLTQIRAAMNNAAETTDPEGAIPIYESILELYGSTQWGIIEEADQGRALVEKARHILLAMQAAKTKSEPVDNPPDQSEKERPDGP